MIHRIGSFVFMAAAIAAAQPAKWDYRLLATNKTSTMEKEMNQAADEGYTFQQVMGGETGFGGKEVVIVMGRDAAAASPARRKYKLLATSRTSTMQKELQQAADDGFEFRGQTVFESTFGGKEVSVILERDPGAAPKRDEYRLLATSRTSTMQKELQQAAAAGYVLVGMSVGKTAMGGSEVVCILKRAAQ